MWRSKQSLLQSLAVLTLLGCATVPKEVVELSYTVGEDIEAVHASYRVLVQTHFDGLRAQTLDFFNNQWRPTFLSKFIESGRLVEAVSDPDPDRVFVTVEIWAETAISTIEEKKKLLLDPIDEDERQLIQSIDDAFANLIRANATITAHLNSIREVKTLQDETLSSLGIKNLRDKVNDGLINASDHATDAIEQFMKAEGLLQEVQAVRDSITNK